MQRISGFRPDRRGLFNQNPTADSISLEPSDGGGWCECDPCVQMGGASTRVVTLANAAAEAINELALGPKYVGSTPITCMPPRRRCACIPT